MSELPPGARRYVDDVARALADLPVAERDALLAEVAAHVAEVARESGDALAARLGDPAAFAAELRSAAGLPPSVPPAGPLARLVAFARPLPRRLAGAASDLAPAWWVLRGYVLAVLVAEVTRGQGFAQGGWLPGTGGAATAVGLVLLCVAGSVWLGRRVRAASSPSRLPRLALAAGNAGLVVLALQVALELERPASPVIVEQAGAPLGLSFDGAPVANVYAVDRRGRPLQDVRLFDQLGRPLVVTPGDPDPARRVVRDARGRRADNAFPIRHRDPGARRVSDPLAGFPEDVPALATPAIRASARGGRAARRERRP